jgi:1,4-dihydroxy-2-naphthoate octaprenyltransferase
MIAFADTLRFDRVPLYARFVRVYIIDPPLAACVGIVAGFSVTPITPMLLVRVLLLVAMGVVLFYIVHALDDITGVKTGVDVLTAPRKAATGEPKLLASGILTMLEAKSLVAFLLAVVILLAIPVLLTASLPALVAILLATVITGQYSYGARWSYRGLGELTVLTNFAACAIVPYIYITGHLTRNMAFIGLLVGVSIVFVTFCSNFLDYNEDLRAGRRSIMVMLGVHRTKIVFAALDCVFWLLYLIGLVRGMLPPAAWLVFVLLPTHVLAVWHFTQGNAPVARRLCFRNNRMHAVLLIVALLIHGAGWL